MPPGLPKKRGPLFWILIVIAVMVVLGGSVLGISTYRTNPSLPSITEDGAEVQIGDLGEASLPAWLDPYPGTKPQGSLSSKTAEGTSLTFHFKTGDSAKQVLDFYAAQVTKAGLEVTSNSTMPGGGMLLAEDRAKKRQVVVTVSATGDVVMSVAEGP